MPCVVWELCDIQTTIQHNISFLTDYLFGDGMHYLIQMNLTRFVMISMMNGESHALVYRKDHESMESENACWLLLVV